MSTELARKKTVEELTLQILTDDEAVRLSELANEGVYDTDDMPERWHGVFEEMEQRIWWRILARATSRTLCSSQLSSGFRPKAESGQQI